MFTWISDSIMRMLGYLRGRGDNQRPPPVGLQIILLNEASNLLLYRLTFWSLKFTYIILQISIYVHVRTPSLKYVPIYYIYLEKKSLFIFGIVQEMQVNCGERSLFERWNMWHVFTTVFWRVTSFCLRLPSPVIVSRRRTGMYCIGFKSKLFQVS